MDLELPAELALFQQEVAEFLDRNWRAEAAGDAAAERDFRRRAVAAGLIYRDIPREHGGAEQPSDPLRDQIIIAMFAAAGAPRAVAGVGVALLVPTLLEHGTEWQKSRFIAPALAGDELWAQGYSEPGAGSDLASLATRAVVVGDQWRVDGRKIWSSGADRARFMFALVRTEPIPRHGGISYLLIDLHQDGVTVRPIPQMTGAASFCEVTFDAATTPLDWIVGARGQGWAVSQSTLRHERNFVGSAAESRAVFDDLIHLGWSLGRDGEGPLGDPVVRRRLATLEGLVEAHVCSGQHQATLAAEGRSAGRLAMHNKLTATRILQEAWSIAAEMLGEEAGLAPAREAPGARSPAQWAELGMRSLSRSIAGGTSNIQRDILARRGLGLPRG